MSENKVEIVLSVKDEGSAAVNKFSQAFDSLMAPIRELTSVLRSLAPNLSALSPAMAELTASNRATAASMEQLTAAAKRTTPAIGQVESALHGQGNAATGSLQGIGSLIGKLGTLATVATFTAKAADAMREGLAFQQTIESSQIGLAAMVSSFNDFYVAGEKVTDGQKKFDLGMAEAAKLQKQLKTAALETTASYTDMLESFQSGTAVMTRSGIGLDKQVDAVKKLTQASTALGVQSHEMAIELKQFFEGDFVRGKLLQRLGISESEFEAAKKSGTAFYDLIVKKTEAYAEAGKRAAMTMEGLWSNTRDIFSQSMGEAMAPVATAIKGVLEQAVAMGGSLQAALNKIGLAVADVVKAIAPLMPVLVHLAILIADAGVSAVKAFIPISPIIGGALKSLGWLVDKFGEMALVVVTITKVTTSLAALTAGLGSVGTALTSLGGPVAAITAAATYAISKLIELQYVRDAERSEDRARQGREDLRGRIVGKTGLFLDMGAVDAYQRAMADLWGKSKTESAAMKAQQDLVDALTKKYDKQTITIEMLTTVLGEMGIGASMAAKDMAKNTEEMEKAASAASKLREEQERYTMGLQRSVTLGSLSGPEKAKKEADFWFEDQMAEIKRLFTEGTPEFSRAVVAAYARSAQMISESMKKSEGAAADAIEASTEGVFDEIEAVGEKAKEQWDGIGGGIGDAITSALRDGSDGILSAVRSLAERMLSAFGESLVEPLKDMIANLFGKREAVTSVGAETGGTNLPAWMGGSGGGGQLQQGTAPPKTMPSWVGGIGTMLGTGAAGFGVGSMIGGGDTANQIGGAAGAILGAKIGSAYPIIGTIIGAVVGAILGELFSPNTESHVTGVVQHEIRKKGSSMAKSIESIYTGIVDVVVAGAKPGDAGGILESYKEELRKAFVGTRFDIAAGSGEDIQKNYEWLVSTLLPKMALQAAFGQKGYGLPHGDRDAQGGRGGLDWWSAGMDQEGNWIEARKQLVDLNAPIPRLLADLGFLPDKINDLAQELANVEDPKAFLAKLQGLVSVVAGINDLVKKLSAGSEGAFTELDKTTQQRLDEQRGDLATGFQNLKLYTGDEQIQKAQELLASAEQWYQANLQYVGQLRSLMEGLLDSIDSQIRGIEDGAKSWGQLMDDARGKAWESYKAAVEAGPETVQKQVQATQEAIGTIVSGLRAVMQAAEAGKTAIASQVEAMKTWDRSFAESMSAAEAKYAGAAATLGSGSILSPDEITKATNDAIAAAQVMFEGFKAIISAAQSEINAAEALQKSIREYGRTWEESMAANLAKVSSASAALAGGALSPEEITKQGTAAREAIQGIVDGLKQLIDAARSEITAIQQLQEKIRASGLTQAQKMAEAAAVVANGITGTTPEEITSQGSAVRTAIETLVSGFQAIADAGKAAKANIDALVTRMRAWFTDPFENAKGTALGAGAALANGNLSAEEITRLGKDATDAINIIFDTLSGKVESLKAAMRGLDDVLASLDSRIAAAMGETSDQQLSRLYGTATASYGAIRPGMSEDEISRLAAEGLAAVNDGLGILIDRLSVLKSLGAEISELSGKFGAAGSDALGAFADSQDPAGAFARDAEAFMRQVTEASKLSGQAQIDAIRKVKASAVDLYQRQQQLLQEISQSAENMRKSIASQIWEISLGEMDSQGQAVTVMDRMIALRGQLATATSSEQVNELTAEIQSLVSRYLGLFESNDPNRGSAVEWAKKFLSETQTEADGAFGRIWKAIETANDKIRGGLEQASGFVAGALTATEGEINKWRDLVASARTSLEGTKSALEEEIKAWIAFANGLKAPLDAVINYASGQIATYANALGAIIPPLQATVTATAGQMQAWGNGLDSLVTQPLQATVTASAGAIMAWAKALDGMQFPLQAQINAAAGEIEKWKNLLVDLRGKVETNITGAIDGAVASFQLLVPEINDAKTAFTQISTSYLPDLQTAADDAASALDRFRDAVNGATGALSQSPETGGPANPGAGAPATATSGRRVSLDDIAAAFRRDPSLLMSAMGA